MECDTKKQIFFISIYAYRTYIFTETILDDNIMLWLDIEPIIVGSLFYILLVLICAAVIYIFNNLFTSFTRFNAYVGVF